MNTSSCISTIIQELKSIELYISGFENNPEISQLELDLVLSKVRTLYDAIIQLKNIPLETEKATQKEKEKRIVSPEVAVKKENHEEPDDLLNIDMVAEEKTKKEEPRKEEAVSTLADKFKTSDNYINEAIAKGKKPDVASKLQSKPIDDIAAAIGVNDKFLFIKELFKGDSARYNQTISLLNNANNFNDAYNYLYENFEWDMDSEHVQKILDLVRRKHIISTHE